MSVQLTVYPQWYDGVVNPLVSVPVTEMLSYPTNFSSIGTSATTITTAVLQQAQQSIQQFAPTMIPNTWYGTQNSLDGALNGMNNYLLFYDGYNSVFQQLSGLVAGALYDVKITWNPGLTPQSITVKIFDNTTLSSSVVAVPVSNEATVQFTAPSQNDSILLLDYANTTNPCIVASVSVKGAPNQPVSTINNIGNGSVICDLYEDEDIPLTLSVDNFKNAAEKVQSYSKAFNLPATKRNNLIFDNVFEITRYVDGNSILFNPLKRTKAVLKQDGFLIFEGYMRMLDITEKNGETSYNVNLYAEVTALSDTLKDRTFQDLGFAELEHDYNRTQIEKSWGWTGSGMTWTNSGTSGFRHNTQTIKYPFVDWNHQMTVSNGILGTAGQTDLQNLEQAFRPWISIKYLVERIFADSPFTYTSTFFDTTLFKKLFMDFNWGAEAWGAAPVRLNFCYQKATSDQSLSSNSGWVTIALPTNYGGVTDLWDNTNYRFVSDVPNLEVSGEFWVYCDELGGIVGGGTGGMRIAKFDKYGNLLEELQRNDISTLGIFTFTGSFGTTLQVGDYIEMQMFGDQIIGNWGIDNSAANSYLKILNYNNESTQVYTLLDSARADINQWEFLKGIMTMFNLIAIPDPDDINNLIIETYEHIFVKTGSGSTLDKRGITHNWTDKVDYSTMKIAPLSDLKGKTIFKYVEDDDDYVFNIYKRDVQGHLYGSKVFDAVYSYGLTLLTGEDEVVAEPFAATVIKPLMSQYADFVVPSIYAMSEDGETEGFANSPRIMYDNGKTYLSGSDYYVPEQNGVQGAIKTQYLQFSHLTDTPSAAYSNDFNFGACQLIPPWAPVPNNLFQMYWMPYYSELYDSNTRVVTVKINLNAGDINTFKFNDQVMIKNRVYRVNKIDYKPNDFATVELILLNYI
jgi:hypothetical protein